LSREPINAAPDRQGSAIAKTAKRHYIGAIRDLACLAVSPTRAFPKQRKIRIEGRVNGSHGRKTHDAFQMEGRMAKGTVKFFNAQKGYGFIVQDAGGPDVFVHISAVERAGMSTLNEGQKLSFDIEADRRSGKSAATNLQAA
jgi:CspA family cold shock protein